MKKFLVASGLAVLFCLTSVVSAQINEKEKEEGFVSIFNGEDLTDWEGNPDLWRVEDGAIVGQTGEEGAAKLTYNQFIIWTGGEVKDFVLRFDIKLSPKGNSGVQYRSWRREGEQPYRVAGYQADFDGEHAHSGMLYGETFRGILCRRGTESVIGDDHKGRVVRTFADADALRKEIKVDDWNAYEVTAKGFTFTNKINNHVMSICTDEDKEMRRQSGLLAFQLHTGPPMKVEIKNIRLRKLESKKKDPATPEKKKEPTTPEAR